MNIYEAKPYGMYVIFYDDKAEFEADGFDTEGIYGSTGWSDEGDIVMYVGDNNLATLVHECVHASLFILEHVGIDVASNQGECQAYLCDNMFSYFMEVLMAKKGSFATKQAQIAKKEGVSSKAAGAILASAGRNASSKAKKANPNLKKIKGKAKKK